MDSKLKKKTFCKWGKGVIQDHLEEAIELTAKPKYICGKCARVARRKANVCDPYELPKKKKKAG
jgi:hypothetical protein